jgi:hypothetical protein
MLFGLREQPLSTYKLRQVVEFDLEYVFAALVDRDQTWCCQV